MKKYWSVGLDIMFLEGKLSQDCCSGPRRQSSDPFPLYICHHLVTKSANANSN